MKVKEISIYAIIVTLYVVITNVLGGISFGVLQFRISEILLLLPFYNKKYSFACIIAAALSNLFSPLGIVDVATGTAIAVISYTVIIRFGNIYIKTVLYSLLCGILVGAELYYVLKLDFLLSALSVMASQVIVCTLIGVGVINIMAKSDSLNKLLDLRPHKDVKFE